MPFGTDPFGATLLGGALPTGSLAYAPSGAPEAVFFDPEAKDFVQDDEGHLEGTTNEDQQVVLAFSVPRGALKHAPEVGHDFMTLPRYSGARLDAEIERRATLATPYDRLLAAGKVRHLGVVIKHPKDTESRIAVKYRNLVTNRIEEVTIGR